MDKVKKLFLVVNVDWFFVSHRMPIALRALEEGYDVTVFSIEEAGLGDEIRSKGLKFVPLPTSRAGTNLFTEFKVLLFLLRKYREGKPDVIHHVAVKPVTYGSIAAKLAKVPKVVNALSGLGFLFINSNQNRLLHWFVNSIFKYGFNNPNLRFILQNRDDFQMIQEVGVLKEEQIFMIKGSGVDLNRFQYKPEPESKPIIVLLAARMLWDKGVGEFVRAAEMLKPKFGDKVNFVLAGNVDEGNKACIPESQLLEWTKKGNVEWIGFQKNMKKINEECHIAVLPSYREGLPKSLIEACAIGRPIITTDVPGCREVVDEGENGFLVENKNPESLANAMSKLIENKSLRLKMGKKARAKAEAEFSIENVLDRTFEIYDS